MAKAPKPSAAKKPHTDARPASHTGAGANEAADNLAEAVGVTHVNLHSGHAYALSSAETLRTRELYWHNVVREMLNALSVLSQSKPEMFDGRFAVLTHAGERIAIGKVFPLFACSIPGSPWEREASIAVQCTVFRIISPDGEVYTLPIHEIRGMHSLTPELIEQLQKSAEAQQDGSASDDNEGEAPLPFGLAAFAALPRPEEDIDQPADQDTERDKQQPI